MLFNVGFFAKDSGDAFVSYTVDLCNGPVNGFNNLCVFLYSYFIYTISLDFFDEWIIIFFIWNEWSTCSIVEYN